MAYSLAYSREESLAQSVSVSINVLPGSHANSLAYRVA